MNDITRKIYLCGIVPVIKIKNAENAVPLARALLDGGLDVIEVTFRTSAAAQAISRISKECQQMLVGAGTVLTRAQVDEAIEAGAKFIVSPGFNPDTVKYCISKNVTVIPGCASCGEMEQAMALGLDTVKFFPAEASGGAAFLKAVSAPYKNLHFMPTGGIDAGNMMQYLSLPCVAACGGSFMAKEALIDAGDFTSITRCAADAVHRMLGFEIKHVGINCDNAEEAANVSEKLCRLLGLLPDDRAGATFVGTLVEVMKSPFRGACGHIAIGTSNPDRARAYLEKLGFEFDESSAKYDSAGRLNVIYLKDEIGGFAFHLAAK